MVSKKKRKKQKLLARSHDLHHHELEVMRTAHIPEDVHRTQKPGHSHRHIASSACACQPEVVDFDPTTGKRIFQHKDWVH